MVSDDEIFRCANQAIPRIYCVGWQAIPGSISKRNGWFTRQEERSYFLGRATNFTAVIAYTVVL
jgi:hypothetical protein